MDGKEAYSKLKRWVESLSPFIKSWDSAKNLYSPDRVKETITDSIKLADVGLAVKIFILAAFLSTTLSILALYESLQLVNFTAETVTTILGTAQEMMTIDQLVPFLIMEITSGIPLALALNIGLELVGYKIAKLSGGEGSLAQHLYMMSIIILALAMLNVLSFLMPIPCIQIIAFAVQVIGLIYFGIYVASRAYSEVHKITMVHSLAIIILVSVIRFTIMAFVINWLGTILNLTNVLNFTGG